MKASGCHLEFHDAEKVSPYPPLRNGTSFEDYFIENQIKGVIDTSRLVICVTVD
jgi:hypothetical protein